MSITGTTILLYTEDGKVACEISASLDYSNATYDLLPNAYSRKKDYGIIDWSIDGSFQYEQEGNYNDFGNKIKQKEKVVIAILEAGSQVRYGYGVIEDINYSASNEQTVSFSATIAGVSKLTEFSLNATVAESTYLMKIINNEVYIIESNVSNIQSVYYVGGSGKRLLFTIDQSKTSIVDFNIYNDYFYVILNNVLYRINKQGYIIASVDYGANAITQLNKVFDNLGEYISVVETGTDIRLLNIRTLALYKTVSSTAVDGYIQLSNGNILLIDDATLIEKDLDNVTINTETRTAAGNYTKIFKSSLNDVYLVAFGSLTSDYKLNKVISFENDVLTTTTVNTSSIDTSNIFELESNILISVDTAQGALLFRDNEVIGTIADLNFDADSLINGFVMDSNGVAYVVSSTSTIDSYIPSTISGFDSYDLPIYKLI